MSAIPIPSFPPNNMKILPPGNSACQVSNKDTRPHKSKMENTNVNLIIHLYVTSELCLKFRKYDPMGCRKAVKADQKGHRCTQKGPQRASKTRDATRDIQKRSPGGGPRPQRRPRGQPRPKSIKFLK